jgi:hypothetical protein
MEPRVRLVAILASVALLLVVLELVRRRRLLERYALLWLVSAVALLALAAFQPLLITIAELIGVEYPPSALFLIAFGFVLLLLLHFSVAVSRLADQSKILAQRIAIMEERMNRAGVEVPAEVAAATRRDHTPLAERERREPQSVR